MSSSHDSLAALRINRPEESPESIRTAKKRRWGVWLVLVVLMMFAGLGIAIGQGYNPLLILGWDNMQVTSFVPDAMKERPKVSLVAINAQSGRSGDAVVVATGYLESRQQARIGARATGRVESVHFEEGSKVDQNAVLAILEHAELDVALKAAEASVAITEATLAEQEITISQSKRDLDRAETLWTQRSIAEAELEQARFNHQAAVARRNSLAAQLELSIARAQEAEQMRENMFIRAPFAGTVISKDAEVGESILPGGMGEASGRGSVATIADLDHLEIECDVKEDFITRVFADQKTEIKVDAVPDKKYHGTVRKVIPMGDRARATIKVRVTIDDADQFLFPEMSGTVYFLPAVEQSQDSAKQVRYFCPSSAITFDSQQNASIWLVDEQQRAKPLPVTVGASRDGRTEILSGIAGNERIIRDPQTLAAGQPVTVIE